MPRGNHTPRAGIRNDAWTDVELQELYEVVNDPDWFTQVGHLPRTEAAIRAKMCALRREAGIIPKPGPLAAAQHMTVRQAATHGSEMLRRAIELAA